MKTAPVNRHSLLRHKSTTTRCSASQLHLIPPGRDKEVLSQRLGAEGALSVHQLPPDDGGPHRPQQRDAQVRAELPTQSQSYRNVLRTSTQSHIYSFLPCFYDVRWLLQSVMQGRE